MSIASLLFEPIEFEQLMASEHRRALLTIDGQNDQKWFRHILTEQEHREFIAGGVYPVLSSNPRVFSTVDSHRRHAVFFDTRYIQYQTRFLDYFARDLAEIANLTGTTTPVSVPDLRNHRAVLKLRCLGYLYAAEVLTAPILKLPHLSDVFLNACFSKQWGLEAVATEVLEDLKFELEAGWIRAGPSVHGAMLARIIFFHELAHVKLNGFENTKLVGSRIVRNFRRFRKAELDHLHPPDNGGHSYSPEFQAELLEHSIQQDGTLEEVAADDLAIRLSIANLGASSFNLDSAKNLVVAQASAIVASTFFGSLQSKIENGARRSKIAPEAREVSEPFTRFNVAMWNLALLLRGHAPFFQDPDNFSELKNFIVGMGNGIRSLELHIRSVEGHVADAVNHHSTLLTGREDLRSIDPDSLSGLSLRSLNRLGWPILEILSSAEEMSTQHAWEPTSPDAADIHQQAQKGNPGP
ncbi:hypothetical protein ELG88_08530 [Rhizobium leguminosarum]|uniref:hypothetical protein n=1 Tax=Rhizobium leguminosarum TaxID=384 RepID=UPI00103054CF|nr:hypothetical protein [Rhizobium leguminosarum]TBF35258.1 hypothetical protein ELG88_08530 [Rhizobium leguminosarum]